MNKKHKKFRVKNIKTGLYLSNFGSGSVPIFTNRDEAKIYSGPNRVKYYNELVEEMNKYDITCNLYTLQLYRDF